MDQDSTDEQVMGISNRFSMQVNQMISSYTAKYKTQQIETLLISSSMPNIERTVVNFNEALPKINVEVFDSLLNVEVPEN